jgi:hypothetical protein
MNANEQKLVDVLRAEAGPLTLRQLAERCWPELAPAQAHSWARNSVRRPYRDGTVLKAAKGTYVAKPLCKRGTSNRNSRGGTETRRRRRERMIREFGSPSGLTIKCFHCGKRMRTRTKWTTWEVDRFPVCGHDGGGYSKGNVVPSCPPCNRTRCGVAGCKFKNGTVRTRKLAVERRAA